MKFTNSPYSIDKEYQKRLETKLEDFRLEAKTKKALRLTMVSFEGLKKTSYSNVIRQVITGEDLFP